MLHLILGILKVIGILLLVLLSLILLGIIALLFVPVRYELAGKVSEENAAVRGRVTWLFRLLSVTAGWKDGRLQARAKLLGFTLFSFGSGKEEKGASREEPEENSGKTGTEAEKEPAGAEEDTDKIETVVNTEVILPETDTDESEEKVILPQTDTDETEEKAILPETDSDETEEKAILPGGITESEAERVFLERLDDSEVFREPSEEERYWEIPQHGEEAWEQRQDMSVQERMRNRKEEEFLERYQETDETEDEVIDETPKGFFKRILEIWNRIRRIPERIRQRLERMQRLLQDGKGRLDRLAQIIQEWKDRLQPFLAPEAKALYRRLLGHLKYIWKHYRPRKLQGWLRFGTGAPDLTGMLTGILYMILPPSAEEFELKPEFTEAMLQTKMQLSGHIRAVHLLKTAFCLWRDKEFRAMIRRVTAR